MVMFVANKLTKLLIDTDAISYEDREIYVYGVHQICLFILNLATTILVGFAFGMIWESILFMIAYIPIRIYAGGYHSNSQIRCYLLSVFILALALQTIKSIPWTGFICFNIILSANIVIAILAPVEDKNKPLSIMEKVVYKRRTYIVIGILDLIALFCWFILIQIISECISIALVVLSMMLVLGKLKNAYSVSQRPREML